MLTRLRLFEVGPSCFLSNWAVEIVCVILRSEDGFCHVVWGEDSGICSSSVDAFSGNFSLDVVVREIQLSNHRNSHNFMCK